MLRYFDMEFWSAVVVAALVTIGATWGLKLYLDTWRVVIAMAFMRAFIFVSVLAFILVLLGHLHA